jgi:hypothetical protein
MTTVYALVLLLPAHGAEMTPQPVGTFPSEDACVVMGFAYTDASWYKEHDAHFTCYPQLQPKH